MAPKGVQDAIERKIDPAEIKALEDIYAPHNAELAKMLGRKLPW